MPCSYARCISGYVSRDYGIRLFTIVSSLRPSPRPPVEISPTPETPTFFNPYKPVAVVTSSFYHSTQTLVLCQCTIGQKVAVLCLPRSSTSASTNHPHKKTDNHIWSVKPNHCSKSQHHVHYSLRLLRKSVWGRCPHTNFRWVVGSDVHGDGILSNDLGWLIKCAC